LPRVARIAAAPAARRRAFGIRTLPLMVRFKR